MTKTGKTDIVLERTKQKECPICGEAFRPEWKDKFKPIKHNGKTVYICKGHPAPEEK